MRTTLRAALLACAVAAGGCTGGSGSGNSGSVGSRGTYGVDYYVTVSRPVGGTVISLDGKIQCGTTCETSFGWNVAPTFTATAAEGYVFRAWGGDCAGTAATCTLQSGAQRDSAVDRTVVAVFDRTDNPIAPPPPSTVPGAPVVSLTITPGPYVTGTPFTLTADGADPDPADTLITCTWTLVAKPIGSAATLPAESFDCSAAAAQAFTADVAGDYVIRVTPSSGTPAVIGSVAQVAVSATSPFGGGAVSVGTDVADPQLAEMAARLHAVLAKGYNNVAPAALAKSLAGLDAANPRGTYAVVDVRLPEDFARGHIPGAVNAPLAQLPDVLLANPFFPETSSYTKKIIVAGYNAGDSTMGAVVFNSARWVGDNATGNSGGIGTAARPAWALKYGMSSWTFDLSASPTRFDDDLNVRRLANTVTTTPGGAVPTGPLYSFTAIGDFTGNPTLTQKILLRSRAFLNTLVDEAAATGVPAREAMWTTFVKLNELRNDGNPANDPQMLDVRTAAMYTTAHVPDAIFIGYTQVAALTATTTRLVDPTRKVFVQCVTGHTGGHATMALGILGYQVRNVLYGMNGWTELAALGGGAMMGFDAQADANDFPLTASTVCNPSNLEGPECIAAFSPARAGCKNCHVDYLAHFIEYNDPLTAPSGAAAAVLSEGEG